MIELQYKEDKIQFSSSIKIGDIRTLMHFTKIILKIIKDYFAINQGTYGANSTSWYIRFLNHSNRRKSFLLPKNEMKFLHYLARNA